MLYLYRLGETGQAERIAAHCAQAWARRKAELFPRGMRRFDPAQEPAPAARGAQFTTVTAFMARMGLTQDGVIVALDGTGWKTSSSTTWCGPCAGRTT